MTYIGTLEEVADEVAQWGVDKVNEMVSALAPDGRGFMEQEKSTQERLEEYLQVRGSPDAWLEWINGAEGAIVQQLIAKGIPPEEIQLINPRDIANAFAIKWSVDSEGLINGRS